ncbi:HAMP domain-containing protein [Geomonas sp. RF6]|uniref:GGDEF domain-containing protein n=1 Tax=Geomonas sp. RF6 TaxID=2897342 RepID=UPI001E2FD935|nr:HAMP domain-containing protein [Geomonas sp. RF6]UFS68947.1 HAMP domain-containing protein [Geomonas sp. RF6]
MGTNPEPQRKSKSFLRLSITRKLIAGYAAMAIFTLVALAFSYRGLISINSTAREIATSDLPAISSLTRLRSSLLAQEGYAGKYAIFRSPEFIDLFRDRQRESLQLLATVTRTAPRSESEPLAALYRDYGSAAQRLFSGASGNRKELRALALRLFDTIDTLEKSHQATLQGKLRTADVQRHSTIRWALLISLVGFLLALVVAAVVIYRISSSIKRLQRATHRFAAGDFDHDPQIVAGDEIGDLASDFTVMAARLKALERVNLDASPLTRLPGNLAIERTMEERLKSGRRFAFCYADLDNFKAYSDRYGYAKGSELIRLSGDIIQQAVARHAGAEGFVGHIGGDDFVMVVPDTLAAPVCETVIRDFDAEVVKHYSEEDKGSGGIEGFDRYGVQRFFPIMSISIAVVICGGAQVASAVELARVSAELKDYVKESPGSSYSIKWYGQEK